MRHQTRRLTTATLAIGAGLALAALVPSDAHAQRLIPQVGLYVPVSSLGEVDGVDGAIDLGKKESTRAYGLGLEWGAGNILSLRGNVGYATSSDVAIRGVGCATCTSRSTMLTLTGGVVARPFRLLLLEPYVVAGMGLKRYDFSGSDFDQGFDLVVDDRNERTWLLGVGGELNLGFVSGIVEVADYFSDYDTGGPAGPQRRHDFVVSLGLAFGG